MDQTREFSVTDLPDRSQDYLKRIFDLVDWGAGDTADGVALSDLADSLGQQRSTASEAVKRLVGLGLVDHAPYRPIRLTPRGRELAVQLVRRHRLVETFLATVVGYGVEEVHAEAEVLEHAVSDLFIERIDAALGHPSHDPHGDPIPAPDGSVESVDSESLAFLGHGAQAEVVRLRDRDPKLLRYLTDHGVAPGARVRLAPAPYDGMARIEVRDPDGAREVVVDADALGHIQVRPLQQSR